MPAAAIATIIAGVATGTGAVIAAHESSSGAQTAADITGRATTHAADLQAQATADALAFQKQQAEAAYQSSVATSRANYGQWAARQRQLGSVGQALGLAPREIPAFETPPDPNLSPGIGTPAGPGQPGGTPGAPLTPSVGQALNGGASTMPSSTDPVMAALLDNYTKLGVRPTGPGSGPTDVAYYAQKVQETGGMTPDNVKYWFGPQGRIATDLAKASGGGGTTTATAAGPVMGSVGSYLTPTPTPVTPALRMPGSVGSYL